MSRIIDLKINYIIVEIIIFLIANVIIEFIVFKLKILF